MGLSDDGRSALVGGLSGAAKYVSLHSADPGSTGAAEISGGAPAYARKAVTWAAPNAGTQASATALLFDVPGATTVTHYGYWSAATGGTFYGGDRLRDIADEPASEVFGGQGVYELTKLTLTAP